MRPAGAQARPDEGDNSGEALQPPGQSARRRHRRALVFCLAPRTSIDTCPSASRRMLRKHAKCMYASDNGSRSQDPAEPAERAGPRYRRCCSMWALCTRMRLAAPLVLLRGGAFRRNAARLRPERSRYFPPPPPPPGGLAPRSPRVRGASCVRHRRPSSSAQAPPANIRSAPRMASRVLLIRRRDHRRGRCRSITLRHCTLLRGRTRCSSARLPRHCVFSAAAQSSRAGRSPALLTAAGGQIYACSLLTIVY
jgi:hypothetical protein